MWNSSLEDSLGQCSADGEKVCVVLLCACTCLVMFTCRCSRGTMALYTQWGSKVTNCSHVKEENENFKPLQTVEMCSSTYTEANGEVDSVYILCMVCCEGSGGKGS